MSGGRYGLEIRSLGEGDAPGVVELLAACGIDADPRRVAERIGRLRTGPSAALVANAWGPPSGVATAHWAPDLLADGPVARLDLVLVSPDARRRGVGRLLLKAVAQAARQAGCLTLGACAPESDATRDFLAASGFETAPGGLVRPLRRRG